MKFLIIDTIDPVFEEVLTQSGHKCQWVDKNSDDEMWQSMSMADGLILRGRIPVQQDFLNKFSNISIIGRVGAGLEHIDVAYAESRGVKVISSPEGNRQAVAEHALGMLLALLNKIPISNKEVRKGQWRRKENEGIEVQGKTVGIIGYGNTGSAFARLISGFQTPILAYDKYKFNYGNESVRESSMAEIFEHCDIVSIHLPLSDETRMLVNADWVYQFHKPFVLINTARGAIVNTAELLDALEEGQVLGACLDVLEYETENLKMPPIDQLPDEAKKLFKHNNVILTPHTAGLTVESYEKLSRILAEKIISLFGRA